MGEHINPRGTDTRILVIKLYAIGDFIMSLPAMMYLRNSNPSARIDLLTGSTIASLAEISAPVDNVFEIDESVLASRSRFMTLIPVILRLKKLQYSRLYLLHRVLPLRLFSLATRIPERTGQGTGSAGLTSVVPFESGYPEHDAERYARLFGWEGDEPLANPDITISGETLRKMEVLTGKGSYAAVNAGGGRSVVRNRDNIRWPWNKFLEIISRLDEIGIRSILVGSSDDSNSLASMRENLPQSTVDLMGRTSLTDVAAVLAGSRLLITNDSGLMHIAGLVKTPTVAVFGPTDPGRCGVFSSSSLHYAVRPNFLSCHPCHPGRNSTVCSRSDCMRAIDTNMVWKAVETVLKDRGIV